MGAVADEPEGSLAKHFSKRITLVNVFHELKFFVIVNIKSLFLFKDWLLRANGKHILADLTHVVVRLERVPQTLVLETSRCVVVPGLLAAVQACSIRLGWRLCFVH